MPIFLLNVDPAKEEWMVGRIKEMAIENGAGIKGPSWVLSDSFTSFDQMGEVYRNQLIKLMEYRFIMRTVQFLSSANFHHCIRQVTSLM